MSKNIPVFDFFLEKSLFCPKWPKREKSRFSLFFSIFLYSGVASGSFFDPQAPCDPL